MIFARTNSGLSNLRRFKGVDLVVFTEGGPDNSFSIEEVLEGKHHTTSDDIAFWRPLFVRFQPNLKVGFRAVGTKSTLKVLASRLAEGSIGGVCVVMDSDYDDQFHEKISHHRVLYTHKYSWESELFETSVIEQAFCLIALSDVPSRELRARVRPVVQRCTNELRHLVRADMICCAAGKPLFRRKGGVSSFKQRRKCQPPELDAKGIRMRLAEKHKEMRGFRLLRPAHKMHVKKHCFGKVLLFAAIQTVNYLLEIYRQPSLRKEYCKKFLLQGFHVWLEIRPGSGAAKHYARVVSAV